MGKTFYAKLLVGQMPYKSIDAVIVVVPARQSSMYCRKPSLDREFNSLKGFSATHNAVVHTLCVILYSYMQFQEAYEYECVCVGVEGWLRVLTLHDGLLLYLSLSRMFWYDAMYFLAVAVSKPHQIRKHRCFQSIVRGTDRNTLRTYSEALDTKESQRCTFGMSVIVMLIIIVMHSYSDAIFHVARRRMNRERAPAYHRPSTDHASTQVPSIFNRLLSSAFVYI